jgi:hypothetical protein
MNMHTDSAIHIGSDAIIVAQADKYRLSPQNKCLIG